MLWFNTRIRTADSVVFFPTYACRSPDASAWHVDVRGWVFVPRERWLVRGALMRLLRRRLQLNRTDVQSPILKDRLRAFLVDNKRRKRVSIRLGDGIHELSRSKSNGHINDVLVLPAERVERLRAASSDRPNWLPFEAVLEDGDARVFQGQFETIEPTGISIVTDIDDTIKITNVPDRRELLFNTFLREFRTVPGMSDVYRNWAARGAAFHYVSSSPWQLFEPLKTLFDRDRFPSGSYHLREFRLKERSTLQHLSGSEIEKRAVIERILAAFPGRRFLFFGDSGERDPEMYGDLARRFPLQTRQICIRNATRESSTSERFQQAFRDLPHQKWRLFDNADELLHDENISRSLE